MSAIYLHQHKDFRDLLRIIEEEAGIPAGLVEKDYWIMNCLYGLKMQNFTFELKGGTSLSKGYGLIHRFSEDIDIHIKPDEKLGINENPNNSNAANIKKKKDFYDQLANDITIDGIIGIERDHAFDDTNRYNSGGIRLHYDRLAAPIEGIKDGILLEAGFDVTAPNNPRTISSWAYDKAISISGIELIDNRAKDIACYDHCYTFVEKLQSIATKFRKEKELGAVTTNYMRQYYDVYCLLDDKGVQEFIGSEEYSVHKKKRFPTADYETPIQENEAFLLKDAEQRAKFKERYIKTKTLYHKGQPEFDDVLKRIQGFIEKL